MTDTPKPARGLPATPSDFIHLKLSDRDKAMLLAARNHWIQTKASDSELDFQVGAQWAFAQVDTDPALHIKLLHDTIDARNEQLAAQEKIVNDLRHTLIKISHMCTHYDDHNAIPCECSTAMATLADKTLEKAQKARGK